MFEGVLHQDPIQHTPALVGKTSGATSVKSVKLHSYKPDLNYYVDIYMHTYMSVTHYQKHHF